jgi:hypothetical protein
MIVVTGAPGQLGLLVIEGLLKKVPAGEIVADARQPGPGEGYCCARSAEQAGRLRPARHPGKAFQRADKLLKRLSTAI